MVSRKCPTHPSLRLELESRLGVGLSLSLWDGCMGGSRKRPTHSSLRLELKLESRLGVRLTCIFRFMGGVGGWFFKKPGLIQKIF